MRNRIQILSSNGPQIISIYLKKGKNQQKIKEVKVSYDEDWINNCITTLRSAYANSPYFDYYFTDVVNILISKPTFLYDYFELSHAWLKSKLSLQDTILTETYLDTNLYDLDLRQSKFKNVLKGDNYCQVFEHKFPFHSNLSILDLLFNLGPESSMYISKAEITDY